MSARLALRVTVRQRLSAGRHVATPRNVDVARLDCTPSQSTRSQSVSLRTVRPAPRARGNNPIASDGRRDDEFQTFRDRPRGLGLPRELVLRASGRHAASGLQGRDAVGGRLLQLDRASTSASTPATASAPRLGHCRPGPTPNPRASWSAARLATTIRPARSSTASKATSAGPT